MALNNNNQSMVFSLGLVSGIQSGLYGYSSMTTTGGPANSGTDILLDAERIIAEKQQILRHPLFPLLSMLFEKCEAATANVDKVTVTEVFNAEMSEFAKAMKNNRSCTSGVAPLVTGNEELDNLMVKAIQVLRIHLLELEKVHELCLDFCSRYISSIKTKLDSHTLLKGDDSDSDYDCDMDYYYSQQPSESADSDVTASAQREDKSYQSGSSITHTRLTSPTLDETSKPSELLIHGRTPFSHIGSSSAVKRQHYDAHISKSDGKSPYVPVTSKRGVLPKHATEVMKSWLFKHVVHPYPTEEEKKVLSHQTNLSILQVNNWFINARRRILQPMLDTCTSPEQSKSRKCKPQIRQAQRFWPFSPSDDSVGKSSTVGLSEHYSTDYTGDKSLMVTQSPMLSQATGNTSPTLLQTNYTGSNSNSDSGECLTDAACNEMNETGGHNLTTSASEIIPSQSDSHLPTLSASNKLEPDLGSVD